MTDSLTKLAELTVKLPPITVISVDHLVVILAEKIVPVLAEKIQQR